MKKIRNTKPYEGKKSDSMDHLAQADSSHTNKSSYKMKVSQYISSDSPSSSSSFRKTWNEDHEVNL